MGKEMLAIRTTGLCWGHGGAWHTAKAQTKRWWGGECWLGREEKYNANSEAQAVSRIVVVVDSSGVKPNQKCWGVRGTYLAKPFQPWWEQVPLVTWVTSKQILMHAGDNLSLLITWLFIWQVYIMLDVHWGGWNIMLLPLKHWSFVWSGEASQITKHALDGGEWCFSYRISGSHEMTF